MNELTTKELITKAINHINAALELLYQLFPELKEDNTSVGVAAPGGKEVILSATPQKKGGKNE